MKRAFLIISPFFVLLGCVAWASDFNSVTFAGIAKAHGYLENTSKQGFHSVKKWISAEDKGVNSKLELSLRQPRAKGNFHQMVLNCKNCSITEATYDVLSDCKAEFENLYRDLAGKRISTDFIEELRLIGRGKRTISLSTGFEKINMKINSGPTKCGDKEAYQYTLEYTAD